MGCWSLSQSLLSKGRVQPGWFVGLNHTDRHTTVKFRSELVLAFHWFNKKTWKMILHVVSCLKIPVSFFGKHVQSEITESTVWPGNRNMRFNGLVFLQTNEEETVNEDFKTSREKFSKHQEPQEVPEASFIHPLCSDDECGWLIKQLHSNVFFLNCCWDFRLWYERFRRQASRPGFPAVRRRTSCHWAH